VSITALVPAAPNTMFRRISYEVAAPPAIEIVNMSEDRHRVPIIHGGAFDQSWQSEEWHDGPWIEWNRIIPSFLITELL